MAKDSSSRVITAAFGGMRRIDDAAAAWVLQERKISRETLERLGVGCGTAFFPDARQQLPCIMFPYEEGTWKARAYPAKAFTSKTGLHVTFWGLRDVLNGPLDRVYVVEGEFDRCALVEAGIDPARVLAAPGASGGASAELQYVKEALKEGLSKAKKFVLCTDQDAPGLELRSSLAQILGVARVEFIDWPEGIKDANEYLAKDGPAVLHELVRDGALPWPAEGVYTMDQIAEPAHVARWHPGFADWGNKLFLAPGMLSVVTGHPGHGKTQLWSQLWFQIMRTNDLVACIATFETKPKPHYQRIIRQLHGCGLVENLDADKIKEADQWIRGHYRFIMHREERPTLEWLLGQAEIVIIRDGAKIVQVDPWNRLEATKEGRESDTDYIGRCLRSLYAFANDFKVHVQILAHPSKMEGYRRGTMPTLEDIANSKHWENMCDQGFVVHRPKLFDDDGNRVTYAELHHLKARFDALGFPAKFGLDYDVDQGRYGTCPLLQRKKKSAKQEAQQAQPEDWIEP